MAAGLERALQQLLREVGTLAPGLRLLVLHGSRGRGDAHAESDWDFGYLGDLAFDPDALLARLAECSTPTGLTWSISTAPAP